MTRTRIRQLLVLAALVVVALLLVGVMRSWTPSTDEGVFTGPKASSPAEGEVSYMLRSGDTMGQVMHRLGLPAAQVMEAAEPLQDLARVRAGRQVTVAYRAGVPHAVSFRYQQGEDDTLVVDWSDGGWVPRVEEREYVRDVITRSMTVTSSLWGAAMSARLRPDEVMRIAEIFQWEVDFNTEIRAGDLFSLVADGLHDPDGTYVKLGDIHAVSMARADGEDDIIAIRHQLSDGSVSYYGPDGTARRRPFLRSPLEFSRVTSGFNPKRFHPVLKKVRPHYGTDFGAPTGTPIRAVGDGVVLFAGRSGGHGLRVRISHPTGHESGYSHMSAISVKKGQKVRQGQTIGKVGSTGLSTGPHCHYELKHRGRHIDPMRADLPTTQPLPKSEKGAFQEQVDRWLPLLEATAQAAR